MQYALHNGSKIEPQKGLVGICLGCGKVVIAKCGKIKISHWAHKVIKDCDKWWESETEWHREWKNKFPIEFREISFHDNINNEVHRADVYTNQGITIEFQNSPISIDELKSREKFYSQMIWIVNGLKFKEKFKLTTGIPDPESPLLNNYDFGIYTPLIFFRKGDINENKEIAVDLLPHHHIELKHIPISNICFKFNWINKHIVWFYSSSPVYLDFGDDFLYWMKCRKQIKDFWYIQKIKKTDFIMMHSN